jgi:hypothetical protein
VEEGNYQEITIEETLHMEDNLSLVLKTIRLRKEEWTIEEKKMLKVPNLHNSSIRHSSKEESKFSIIEEAPGLTPASFHLML